MATDINANLSTEQLRESLGNKSSADREAEPSKSNGYMKPIRSAPAEETPDQMRSSSERFRQIDWKGGGREALAEQQKKDGGKTSRQDGVRPAGQLAADERFRAVPWDPSEAERRRERDYEQQQKEAAKKAEEMKLGNFFDEANF